METKIYIDWIRHGFSCANAIKTMGEAGLKSAIKNIFTGKGIKDTRAIYASDSILSNYGMEQAAEVNKNFLDRINSYDIMLCSELTRATETATIIAKNTNIKTIFMVPYISEARTALALSEDKDNQARDPAVIKKYIETTFPSEQGYPKLNIDYVSRFKGQYNPNKSTLPDDKLFYEKVLPQIIAKDMAYLNKNVFRIGIVSHAHFIKHLFSKKYPNKMTEPIKNTQIFTEILTVKDKKASYAIPENCKTDATGQLHLDNCQIPLTKQVKKDLKKDDLSKNLKYMERCFESDKGSELKAMVEKKIKSKGGYYEKYVKYKLKYLALKNKLI